MKNYTFAMPFIPDCTQYRYASQQPGKDARAHVFERWESLLHMLARFAPGSIAATLRADFSPEVFSLQERLRWSLRVAVADELGESTVRSLVQRGPVGMFYDFIETGDETGDATSFTAAAEMLRAEETLAPRVPVEANENVKHIGLYYAVRPLAPRAGNDYLMLDRVLARIEEPVRIEWRVEPADLGPVRETLLKYMSVLMSVNQGTEEVYLAGVRPAARGGGFGRDEVRRDLLPKPLKRDPMADEFLRPLQEVQEVLREPHLRFDVRVFSQRKETAVLVGSTLAESALTEGKYQILAHGPESPWLSDLVSAMRAGRTFSTSYASQWFPSEPKGHWLILRELARMAPVRELSGVWRLPVASAGSPCCLYKSSDPGAGDFARRLAAPCNEQKNRNVANQPRVKRIVVGDDLEMGAAWDERVGEQTLEDLFDGAGRRAPLAHIDLEFLKKHLFIAGVPGSGKTTAVFNLLVQLHRHGIPFLVIEPAKTEYRVLKTLGGHDDPLVRSLSRELRVYTPGSEDLSPLRFNPLAYPRDAVTRDEHIDAVLRCFKAGMEMWGPMEAVIGESLEAVYRETGEEGFPTLLDLLEKIRTVIGSKGYQGEVLSNLTAATEVRIGGLTRRGVGRVFECKASCPEIDDFFSIPAVIEMEHMGPENGCLMTLFLLAAMRERIKGRPSGCPLRHVIVIEEAHNVIGRTQAPAGGDGPPSPRAVAAEYVARMLAELRALGEGIIVVDQLPTAVAADVIKNTGTKIALRQVSEDDRKDLGNAMLLDGEQQLELARLRVGESFLYHEALHNPRRVQCLDSAAYLGLDDGKSVYPAGKTIVEHLWEDDWFQDVLMAQTGTVADRFAQCLERNTTFGLALRRAQEECDALAAGKGRAYAEVLRDALGKMCKKLLDEFDEVYDEMYVPLLRRVAGYGGKHAKKLADDLEAEVNEQVVPALAACNDWFAELRQQLSELVLAGEQSDGES